MLSEEFWISIIKILMILGAFIFTFTTMVGGNPVHDKYGFRSVLHRCHWCELSRAQVLEDTRPIHGHHGSGACRGYLGSAAVVRLRRSG